MNIKEIKIILDEVEISLKSENTEKLREVSSKIMERFSGNDFSLMEEINTVLPPEEYEPLPPDIIPPSEKQKKLLMRIPECAGRDINRISKKECGEIIERWNKSRNYSYVDQFGVTHY